MARPDQAKWGKRASRGRLEVRDRTTPSQATKRQRAPPGAWRRCRTVLRKSRALQASDVRVCGRNSAQIPVSSGICNWELAWARPRPLLPPPPQRAEIGGLRECASRSPPSTVGPHHPLEPLEWTRDLEREGRVPRMVATVVLGFTLYPSTWSRLAAF